MYIDLRSTTLNVQRYVQDQTLRLLDHVRIAQHNRPKTGLCMQRHSSLARGATTVSVTRSTHSLHSFPPLSFGPNLGLYRPILALFGTGLSQIQVISRIALPFRPAHRSHGVLERHELHQHGAVRAEPALFTSRLQRRIVVGRRCGIRTSGFPYCRLLGGARGILVFGRHFAFET